jgi:hypothetical protein
LANPWSRRRVLQCLAGLPLATAAACRTGRPGVPAATRITLAGQALMTHPLCDDPYPGLDEVVAELSGGAAVFTDLEAAILTPESGKPTRDTVFLHVAPPSVLSCLHDMGFNLLALGNNHAWDLGTAGVMATRAAVAAAGFGFAGTGADLAEASAPGVSPGVPRVALVSMATGKIREGAAATTTRAGVNELRMRGADLDEGDVGSSRDVASTRAPTSTRATARRCCTASSPIVASRCCTDWAAWCSTRAPKPVAIRRRPGRARSCTVISKGRGCRASASCPSSSTRPATTRHDPCRHAAGHGSRGPWNGRASSNGWRA